MSNGISKHKFLTVCNKTNERCAYCGKRINFGRINCKYQFAVDHVIPKVKGGTNDINNLLLSCSSCNTSKGKKSLEEFRYSFTFKLYGIPKFSWEQIMYLKEKVPLENIFPPLEKFYFEKLQENKWQKQDL